VGQVGFEFEQVRSDKFYKKKIVRSRVRFESIRSGSGRVSGLTLSVFFGSRVGPGRVSGSYEFRSFRVLGHSGLGRVSDHLISDSLGIRVVSDRAGSYFFFMFYFGSGRIGFQIIRL
jgi:hypothetical protein